ncbi:hypothetical protein PNQ29_03540 [Halobacterium salinarum]|uniref:hypothetical protein n=1 Tax=Halobacterium salinarum TaxID=2242 RepID=UPI0025528BB9|nr:hypothetical protein [Halobacterium salinarum]MDL0118817.1 hypothetical protein [Halobacterium salinarum]
MAQRVLSVSKYRAIMTTTDRERISGEANIPAEKEYQTVHRIRSRIKELQEDTALLEKHHPDLYEELQEAVCDSE